MLPRSLLIAVPALAALAASPGSQGATEATERPLGRTTRLRPRAYDLEAGRMRRQVPSKRASETFCYVNTDRGFILFTDVGYLTPREAGTETIVDWGVMGGTSSTLCSGLSDIVTRFRFAYATTSLDSSVGGPGAALTLSFYQPYAGWGADSGNLPIASFAFSGLPGSSGSSTGLEQGYGVDVDLSGGHEILLATGTFGFGYASSETSNDGDGFANTGPILCYSGTVDGDPEPSTGNFPVYDSWLPDTSGVTGGTFFSSWGFDAYSWYLAVARADLSDSPAAVSYRNAGSNPASYAASTAPLGGTFTANVDNALVGQSTSVLFAFDTPFTLTLGGGQTLLAIDLGSGELFSGAGLAPAIPGALDEYVLAMPTNVDFCGLALYSQALQLGVPPFELSNAQDLVLGG